MGTPEVKTRSVNVSTNIMKHNNVSHQLMCWQEKNIPCGKVCEHFAHTNQAELKGIEG